MIRATLYILFSFLLLPVVLQAQVENKSRIPYPYYPSYNGIINYFFDNYHFEGNMEYLKFSKKPDGWYIEEYDFTEGELLQSHLLWSLYDNRYEKIPLKKLKGSNTNQKDEFQSGPEEMYERCVFYGYRNWSRDVIEEYSEIAESLSDTLLESLGNAYSHFATTFIRDAGVFQLYGLDVNYPYQEIPGGQLLAVKKFGEKAAKTFKILDQLNPNYETATRGIIHNSYANEWMELYLRLLSVKAVDSAALIMQNNLYQPYMLNLARHYLETCAPNAILFTSGPNDTYPLMYVQEKEGFRKDIQIVNLELMSTDWYPALVNDQYHQKHEKPLFKAPIEKVSNRIRTYSYLKNDDGDALLYPMLLEEFLTHVFDDENLETTEEYVSGTYPTQKVNMNIDTAKVFGNGTVAVEDLEMIVFLMEWNLNKNKLTKPNLLLLDIIRTNNFHHPIYFTIANNPTDLIGLGKYLQQEGTAYRLVPVMDITNNYLKRVRPQHRIMYYNITEHFEMFEYPEQSLSSSSYSYQMFSNYRIMLAQLARDYLFMGQNEKAIDLLNKTLEWFPDKKMPFTNENMFPIIQAYYDAGMFKKAEKLVSLTLNNFIEIQENGIKNKLFRSKQIQQKYLKAYRKMAGAVNQTKLVKKIDKAMAYVEVE